MGSVPAGSDDASGIPVSYFTKLGTAYATRVEEFLASPEARALRGRVQLIFTSPPFPLNRKKRYGNKVGEDYVAWLSAITTSLRPLLRPDGSLVVEIGNAWEPGKPTMSTLSLRALIGVLDDGKYELCQQFVAYNPARLPSPVQWVNIERIRVKDAFTHIWWMSKSSRPKADNRRVLRQYSASMEELLRKQAYNGGDRPSGHHIGARSFLANNGGSIPPNVLRYSNTRSNDEYARYCRDRGHEPHPARMPDGVADFFIRFLSNRRSIVLDPFAGSNTTGAVAERLGRRWIAVEPNEGYLRGSVGRFDGATVVYGTPDRVATAS